MRPASSAGTPANSLSARIQAVDIVRPLLARMLGLSELRIRLAGSGSSDGRLAFLSDTQANELRFVLL